ncbi:hypothetical protein ACFQL7_05220 [Halocatena marina]|uniref:PRC-barrel domain containing protein n=1 Tax=Halocatena marina TaxID=2934937 RepID=A0ABD5YMS2_9EURY
MIDESDEGKTVVDPSGETVGIVVDVDNTIAHVEPDPGLTDRIATELGWGDSDEETYHLRVMRSIPSRMTRSDSNVTTDRDNAIILPIIFDRWR